METKFNFYDFVGYVIPGALLLGLLYWASISFFALPLTVKVDSIGESILFVASSYFAGHLVQALGNVLEAREVKKWGGWYSVQFLRDSDTHYTPQFKREIKRIAEKMFGLSPEAETTNSVSKDKRYQEIFNLCYALIVQEGAATHTEIFNGIYSLYRGMLAAVWIGLVISLAIFLKASILAVLALVKAQLPQGDLFKANATLIAFSALASILFGLCIRPIRKRFARFGWRFADSVYRNFYVWSKRKG